jgi:cell division septum initiation protein DivIVA
MKTIKSIKQLRREKRRLQQQVETLEQDISHNWQALKHQIGPHTSTSQFHAAKTSVVEAVLSRLLHIGAGVLAKKISEKVEPALQSFFNKHQ